MCNKFKTHANHSITHKIIMKLTKIIHFSLRIINKCILHIQKMYNTNKCMFCMQIMDILNYFFFLRKFQQFYEMNFK